MYEAGPEPEQAKPVLAIALLHQHRTIIAIIATTILAVSAGYLLGTGNTSSSHLSSSRGRTRFAEPSAEVRPISSPPTLIAEPWATKDATISAVVQAGYFFEVTVPQGYALIKDGAYTEHIADRGGVEIIRFYFDSSLGERSPTGQTLIDSVPFTVDYSKAGIIGCDASLYPTNEHAKPGYLYFGIYPICKDGHEEQIDLIKRVIGSIRFGESLRAVLEGNSPPPMLRY